MRNTRPQGRPLLVGLVIGVAVGLIAGVATETLAGFGKKGWERFGPMFQQGYVAGFIDAVRLAKSRSPQSYLALNYPIPAAAKAVHWAHEVKQLYAEERFQKLYLPDVLQIAAKRLSTRMGAEATYQDPSLESMRRMVEQRHKALVERMKKLKREGKLVEGKPLPPREPEPTPEERLEQERRRVAERLGSTAPAWHRMGKPVRRGFVTGFTECVAVAKATDPDGFVARTYALPARTDEKEKHWQKALEAIYGRDDERRVLEPVSVAMAWAGKELIDKGAPALVLSASEVSEHGAGWRRAIAHGPTSYEVQAAGAAGASASEKTGG